MIVISKTLYPHDVQSNSLWAENPYGSDYAIVPDDLAGILETLGYCDITLDESDERVIAYTPRGIPEVDEILPEVEDSQDQDIELYDLLLTQDAVNAQQDEAILELYELVGGGESDA